MFLSDALMVLRHVSLSQRNLWTGPLSSCLTVHLPTLHCRLAVDGSASLVCVV